MRGGEDLRLLVAEPPQLGERIHRVNRTAGAPVERSSVGLGAEAAGVAGAARVRPDDRGRERLAVCVQGKQAVHRAAEAQRLHAPRIDRRRVERVTHRAYHAGPHHLHVLLRP
ncbi:MAG: hypothetical protein M5R40_11650 [Anaerolineae bacterium]|nr:hypothetical protein [Anaerolineae bacterium]